MTFEKTDPIDGRALFRSALVARNESRPPVWLMRQAGRYLPEYRALRERHSFKEMCDRPELALEVSLLPHRLLDVDAIIVFYDILIPLEKMGAPLHYGETGPVFTEPLRDAQALARLRPLNPAEDCPALLDTIRALRSEVGDRKAVLGFGGAPFTLASYLVEGKLGQGVERIRRLLHEEPAILHTLLEKLADMTAVYLAAQVEAGADAVQLFDTWAGHLSRDEYREFVQPYHQKIFDALGPRGQRPAPAILFVRDATHLIDVMAESSADALSVEWRVELARAREIVGPNMPLQGNLDPTALFAPEKAVRQRVQRILEDRRGDSAYIFNLGHGVLPGTPVENVRALVETVRSFRP